MSALWDNITNRHPELPSALTSHGCAWRLRLAFVLPVSAFRTFIDMTPVDVYEKSLLFNCRINEGV